MQRTNERRIGRAVQSIARPVLIVAIHGRIGMKLFFSVGEPSGDLHGANLIRALQSLTGSGDPRQTASLECTGFGGPKMAAAGCHLLQDMSELAVMGLFPVLAKLPKFFALRDRASEYFREHRPDAVVLIDYPGFNWHIARAAKELEIPVFYYGLPQLWAWGKWRVKKVRELVDHALCKLPFEETWFRDRGCRATYVGHPYFDELRGHRLDHPFLDKLAMQRGRLVTILPGSRTQEVKSNLPQLLKAAQLVSREVSDVRFAIASYNERQAILARRMVATWSARSASGSFGQFLPPIEVHTGHTHELILSAQACLATSGSVSLELLYHAKPSVILYHVPICTYAVIRRLVKVRYITLVNLLAADQIEADAEHPAMYDRNRPGHERVLLPEYPTWRNRAADLASHVVEWLTDEPARQRAIAGLANLRDQVARGGASQTAAEYILRQLAPHEPLKLPIAPAREAVPLRKAS
jgi:lipid-A-disaccharide synthase